ncbi:MAG: rod shape-determining protein MreC [Actinomycetota bacterium]|nr:rod shape-determining protein MreC [Actinomycetota bacterium]
MAGVLVLLSLVLITIYFRESAGGGLHSVQSGGATVLRPFEVGAERIVRPFRDAYGYFAGLIHAKSQNARLRAQVDDLTGKLIQNSTAADENADLRRQLNYVGSRRFPQDYDPVTTEVTSRAPSEFQQQIGIAAGSTSGIRKNDPVVTADGLVGLITQVAHDTAQVTLLTDPNLLVSALDMNTKATGMLSPGQGRGTLTLGRVPKSQALSARDTIVTQGWRFGDLSSNYPRGILIGYISGASQSEVDLFWQAQVSPSVHFDSLRSVIVLVRKDRTGR